MRTHPGLAAAPITMPTVCDLIDQQAARLPHKTAVIDGMQHTTYAELLGAANRCAAFLLTCGLQPGARVGIAMERSLAMVVWVLAILKTGAAYVPLDPAYPPDRLRFVVEEAGLRLAITDDGEAGWAQGLPLQLIRASAAGAANAPCAGFVHRAEASYPAYVIYTSGSTGVPKGVEVSHAALAHFVTVVPDALGIREDDIWLLTASISYAVQVRQVMTPLTVGATIAVATAAALRDPLALMEAIKSYGVTLVDFVPSYWRTCNRVLGDLPAGARARLLDNRLRQIVSVGEPLTYDLPQTWRQTFGHRARIVNILGQTETTGMFTSYVLPADLRHCDGVVPVGAPLPGVELHLHDAHGCPVAEGEPGEVYLSTPCLARGYLRRPELTAQRFLPHPAPERAGDRLYRTGDLARWRHDGSLQYLGRSDQQVKVRGKRVDLVEVEAYLRHTPGVEDAAVVARQNTHAETKIAGFVTVRAGAAPSLKSIWADLRLHLPEHALPSEVYCLATLPYLPNGKLDRQALAAHLEPVHDGGRPVPNGAPGEGVTLLALGDSCAPQDGSGEACGCEAALAAAPAAVQATLLAVWAAVLGVERVCLDDDFFAIGGTSLQAALLASRVGLALGKPIPVDLIYRAPTVATLALAVERLPAPARGTAPQAAESPLVLLRPGSSFPPLFIVHGLGGGVVGYADLVHHLGGDCAVYGLKAAGLDDGTAPDGTIDAMARRYIAALRIIQPHGPYRVVGYCYGGVVAFAMAQQLTAAGETVDLVGIIEGFAPGWRAQRGPLWQPQRLRLLVGSMPFWWQDYRDLGPHAIRRRFARVLRNPSHLAAKGALSGAHPGAPAATGVDVAGQELYPGTCGTPGCGLAEDVVDDDLSLLPGDKRRLLELHLQAIRSYAPAFYAGRVTLFRSRNRSITDILVRPLDADMGWGRLAGAVTVHEVAGAHRNIHLMPHVRSLAAALGPYLAPYQGVCLDEQLGAVQGAGQGVDQ